MTGEIVYTHASGDALTLDGKPTTKWDNERLVSKQENRMGISNDPNKVMRIVTINSYIDSSDLSKINRWMMPSAAVDYAAKTDIDYALHFNDPVYSNLTAPANSAAVNDVALLPAAPAVGDAFYFGMPVPLCSIAIEMGVVGSGVWTITWEYYDGDSWEAFSGVNDDTLGFRGTTGLKYVSWTIPPDWAQVAVDGKTRFWVRARVSAYTSTAVQPLGTQIFLIGIYPYLTLVIDASITWKFPCQMQKPSTTKSNVNKYGISVTFGERTL